MKLKIVILVFLSALIMACDSQSTTPESKEAPEVYTKKIEDEKAAQLVFEMMEAMGGVEKWENLKYVSWTFFGARHLVWDKLNSRVRIESPKDSTVYLVNLEELSGKYSYNGVENLNKVELSEKLKKGKSIWINDMYWLFMPFKLYDQGVFVKYLKSDTTLVGDMADILELSFDNVGNTPENKYQIYIDQKDHLIKQWNFFADANQAEASAIWPWDNYSDFNGLKLSSDRTDKSGPSNVRVYEHLDDEVFTSFKKFLFYE